MVFFRHEKRFHGVVTFFFIFIFWVGVENRGSGTMKRETHIFFICIYIYMYVYVYLHIHWLNLLKGLFMARFINTPGVGGGEISPRGDSTATCLGGWVTFDLPGRTRSALSAYPFSTTKVSLNYHVSLTS